jgi:hypothetical protein
VLKRVLPKRSDAVARVFLNLAYVRGNEELFIGLIAGVTALGLLPTCALGHRARFQYRRTMDTIASSRFSIHDLSVLGADGRAPRTAHFNMPFELGVAAATARDSAHDWFVFGRDKERIERALSDIKTVTVHDHDGSGPSVVNAVSRALFREKKTISFQQMVAIHADVRRVWSRVQRREGFPTPFLAPAFAALFRISYEATKAHLPRVLR